MTNTQEQFTATAQVTYCLRNEFDFIYSFISYCQFPLSQWETSLQSNTVSHWLGESQWFKMGKRIIWNIMVIPSVKYKPMFLIFCLGSWVYNWSVGVTYLVKCLNPIFVCNSSRLVLYCLVAIQIWYRHGNNPILNSLVPGRFEWKICIGNLQANFDVWCIYCEIVCRQMSLDLTIAKSTLVQVMAWCHQATSHYLSQCWPRSM